MKKSTRILAILMAFAMLIGSFSVMGSAYQAYKDAGITKYDDVNDPVFTTEQYASMALDEVDRMLAKANLVVNIYIGTLDLGSINTTIASLNNLYASVQNLLPMLGDAGLLDISRLSNVSRSTANSTGTKTDVEVIYTVLDLLGDNATLVGKYVDGSITLGAMNSFIKDYVFDLRELVLGLVYGMTTEGKEAEYDYFDAKNIDALPAEYKSTTSGAINLAQALLNQYVLGKWEKLDDYFDDTYSYITPDYYSFKSGSASGSDVSNEKINTTTYDYYGWVHYEKDKTEPTLWVPVGLGDAIRVANGAAAPSASFTKVDIRTDKTGYTFIEDLMQQAFNYVAVPVLNSQTRPWVRKLCGVTYLDKYTRRTIQQADGSWVENPDYNRDYDGENFNAETDATELYKIFNIDGEITKVNVPSGMTFIEYFNDALGQECAAILKNNVTTNEGTFSWTWTNGGNQYLFDNIVSVGRFVLQVTGDYFFPDFANVPTATELAEWNGQQIVALIARTLLNNFVDWMYIDENAATIMDVAYAAVEQLAWQDLPQNDYTKPAQTGTVTQYYEALRDACLNILMDVAAYNLNQNLDTVGKTSDNPIRANGLLNTYTNNYQTLAVQVACWAVTSYAAIINGNINLNTYINTNDVYTTAFDSAVSNVTMDQVWADVDTIVDAILPIKAGNSPILYGEIASQGLVAKSLIFDYILAPIYNLDSTNLAKIFLKNDSGLFATNNGVKIILKLLENIFNLLAPGVYDGSIASLDELLVPATLAPMVEDFIKTLGSVARTSTRTGGAITPRAANIVKTALPIVCMVLGLSDDQDFEEMSIYMPTTISNANAVSFEVYNGSSGVNTYYKPQSGSATQDKLYTYKIDSIICNAYKDGATTQIVPTGLARNDTINGGSSATMTIAKANLVAGSLIKLDINYTVLGEDGTSIATVNGQDQVLTTTVYGYVGSVDKDDDATEESISAGDRSVKYAPAIYINERESLSAIEGYSVRVKDNNGGSSATAKVNSVSGAAFAVVNSDSQAAQTMEGSEGLYFFNPYKVATKANDEKYERQKMIDDPNAEVEEGEEVPQIADGGVVPGTYNLTASVNVAGTNVNVPTKVVIYYDHNLPNIFNSAVNANRQQSAYPNTVEGSAAWSTYTNALATAAALVLKPKVVSEFDAAAMGTAYENAATALEDAIDALDAIAISAGVEDLKTAVANRSGNNTLRIPVTETVDGKTYSFYYEVPLEYDDEAYTYFGMRDAVPHTYNRYKKARNAANDLINKEEIIVPAPFSETRVYGEGYQPTDDEVIARENAIKNAAKRADEAVAVSSIDAKYAQHKVELTDSRVILLGAGDNSKLQAVYTIMNHESTAGKTAESKEAYERAVAFAADVLSDSTAVPSKITEALGRLVYAYKHLVQACDFTQIDATIATYAETYALGSAQTTYTAASYQAFVDAYEEAVNLDRAMGYTDYNQRKIDDANAALIAAYGALQSAAAAEPVWPTENLGDGEDHYFGFNNVNATFTPYIDGTNGEDDFLSSILGPTVNGEAADGFIFGVGATMGEDEIYAIFPEESLTNCHVEIVPNEEDPLGAFYGTGTVINIVDNSGVTRATYIVIVRGDVNGDGMYDADDQFLVGENFFADNFEMGEGEMAYRSAASNFGEGGVSFDLNDAYGSYFLLADGTYELDQNLGTVEEF